MKIVNEVKINFLSKSANEAFARTAVCAFLSQLDPTVDEVVDVKTAVSEAVTNSIVHAYKETIGKIVMTMRILEDNTIYIKIKDNGCGIDNIKMAMTPLFTTAKNDERAGLGFAVMESFMDKVKVYSDTGKGTSVIMTKKLNSRDFYD
ncbi:MAG: anti-sigma F factor [Oscillospiraceae bacterium]